MLKTVLNSKIHRAVVTQCDLHYNGSISIDQELLDQAEISENEQVHVLNINNGERIITYAIPAEAGSKTIGINGAAAHLFNVGDRVIICSFVQVTKEELAEHQAKIILVNDKNLAQKAVLN